MSHPNPLETIQRFMEAVGRKDYETALGYVAPDCEYTNVPLATVRGPEGVRAVLEPFFAPTIENEFVWKHTATEGDTTFVERLDRHHLDDPDRWVELPVTGVFEVREGQITLWRDYFDAPTILNEWPLPQDAAKE